MTDPGRRAGRRGPTRTARLAAGGIAVGLALTGAFVVPGPLGSAPAGAVATDPPVEVDLPLSEAWAVATLWANDTGALRAFVLGPEGVAVREQDGAAVGLVPVTGDEMVAGARAVFVLDRDAPAVTVIDPDTLDVDTVSLEGLSGVTGLAAGRAFFRSAVWVTAVADDGTRTIVEVDTATGARIEVATGLGELPLALEMTSDELIAVQLGASAETGFWQFLSFPPTDPLELADEGTFPIGGVRAFSGDVYGLLLARHDDVVTYRLFDRTLLDQTTGAPGTPVVVEGGAVEPVTTAGPDDGTISLRRLDPEGQGYAPGDEVTGAEIDRAGPVVSWPRLQAPLYAVNDGGAGAAELQIWDLAPRG